MILPTTDVLAHCKMQSANLKMKNEGKNPGKVILQLAFCNWHFAILLFLVAGCSYISLPFLPGSSEASNPNSSAEALYKEGAAYLNNKKYVPAIERFQRVKAEFPFASNVLMAELKLGEAYYLNEQYPEAVEAFKEFVAMHPTNENIPFVLYLAGMAHFDQTSTIDRDQKLTEIARGYFERVVKDYPKSPYAPKAEEKLAKCLEYLAEHEFGIASFYLSEKKYPAAQNRFEDIVRRYRSTPTAPKALYQAGESYRLDKNNVKAALAYEALIQHYPSHPLAKTAQAQLSDLAKVKQDPLATLLKRDRRSGPAPESRSQTAASGGPQTEANKLKDLNLVTKTEVVNEEGGSDKGIFRRVIDKINPFSSSSSSGAPPEKPEKKQEAKPQVAPGSANKEQSGGFFSSLLGAINPFAKKPPEAAKNPPLVGNVDDSLKQRGIAVKPGLQPPAANLPEISEAPAKPPADVGAMLGAIDSKLEKKGKNAAELPPPPEPAPALKAGPDGKSPASKATAAPAPDTSSLISNIDEKLKRRGVDPAKLEEAVEAEGKTAQDRGATATARPKREAQIQLEPRLSADKKPFFLNPKEVQLQEKSVEAETPSKALGSAPSSPAAPSPSDAPKGLPQAAVKGPPPQPVKEKPADQTSLSTKKKADGDEEENKGVFEQIKEDIGRIGKILNPFSW